MDKILININTYILYNTVYLIFITPVCLTHSHSWQSRARICLQTPPGAQKATERIWQTTVERLLFGT